MRTLKTIILSLACLLLFQVASAQEIDYLQKAREYLSNGNCYGAQSMYDAWKKINNGQTNDTIERQIANCKSEESNNHGENAKKTYKVGDRYGESYPDSDYIVVYVDPSGNHGWIMDKNWIHQGCCMHKGEKRGNWRIPTIGELRVIYNNRRQLSLYNEYWTQSLSKHIINWEFFYTIDFSTGVEHSRSYDKEGIYRLYIKDF